MMYGCPIDQRLMLPRARLTSSGTSASRLKAVALHDDVAGPGLPLMCSVSGHADDALQGARLTLVDMNDVRMGPGAMEHGPRRTRQRDLDDFVLTDVARELQVHRVTRPVHEVDALSRQRPQRPGFEPVIFDDDLRWLRACRNRYDDDQEDRHGSRERSHAHRYSSRTGLKVDDSPWRHTVTATASPILCRSRDS